MSEQRTVEQIHKEYSALAAQAGHINYQIFVQTKDLEVLNQQMRDLNFEASKLQADAKAAEVEVK